ncbi:MAG: type III pantothenate kinase [Kiritimatiellia bacterium]
MSRCLAIDVGNTSTTLGVVDGLHVLAHGHVHGGIDAIDEVLRLVNRFQAKHPFDGAVLASVVPTVNRRWEKFIKGHTGYLPVLLTHTVTLAVGIDYPHPETIGADRLANACAAAKLYGAPAIVADFGTALTFDVVNGKGRYVGGVIAPGMPLMTDYLAERTALLPLISPRGRCDRVGRSTEGAMRIGARIGYRGMIREITDYLRRQPGMENATCCATGGFADWVLKDGGLDYRVDPDLTLKGLGVVYDLNR